MIPLSSMTFAQLTGSAGRMKGDDVCGGGQKSVFGSIPVAHLRGMIGREECCAYMVIECRAM